MEVLVNQERIQAINKFMNELEDKNSELSKPEIYRKYESAIKDITATDIFLLDWYQNDTSLDIEELKETAGKFVNVFYHGLIDNLPETYDSDLLSYFTRENTEIETVLDSIKKYFKKGSIVQHRMEILKVIEQCDELEKKFQKRELILYPRLEAKTTTTKPFEVLWSLNDDARKVRTSLIRVLKKPLIEEMDLIYLIGEYYNIVYGINNKEELILFPIASKLLSIDEKTEMFEECLEYGFSFITDLPYKSKVKEPNTIREGYIKTNTGELSITEFTGVMKYIPIDITFVDVNDQVRYFNDRKERHFPRNKSIIGRLVSNCHPPKSVHIVEQIMDAFKNGTRDVAEFWIDFNKSFLYITYYAVKDENNKYIGTLEVSQDVTRIRNLSGQQRLLDWK
jgi:DUF438 domain-containing protein